MRTKDGRADEYPFVPWECRYVSIVSSWISPTAWCRGIVHFCSLVTCSPLEKRSLFQSIPWSFWGFSRLCLRQRQRAWQWWDWTEQLAGKSRTATDTWFSIGWRTCSPPRDGAGKGCWRSAARSSLPPRLKSLLIFGETSDRVFISDRVFGFSPRRTHAFPRPFPS